MKIKSTFFTCLFISTLIIGQDRTPEPSFAYDFDFIIPSSYQRYEPLNSTTLNRAFRNVHSDMLDYYKQQLVQMDALDQRAILSNIDFTDLKNYLTPELQHTQRYFINHPSFNFFYVLSFSTFCLMAQKLEIKQFQLQSIQNMSHNFYELYSQPSAWFLTYGLLGLMYYNYIYHQTPIVKTMAYLHNLENHYRTLPRA